MTKEQEFISWQNKQKAREYFGIVGNKNLVLHHINPDWRHNDTERYIQWNIEDLVVMENAEHSRWHCLHRPLGVNEKISQALKGHSVSEDTREKLRKANLGKKNGPASEERKCKISEAVKGERNGANTHPEKNYFINNNPGKLFAGTHYYNNGTIEVRAKECPEGFVSGRLRRVV